METCFGQAQPGRLQHGVPDRSSDSTTGCHFHVAAGVLSLLLLSPGRRMSVLLLL